MASYITGLPSVNWSGRTAMEYFIEALFQNPTFEALGFDVIAGVKSKITLPKLAEPGRSLKAYDPENVVNTIASGNLRSYTVIETSYLISQFTQTVSIFQNAFEEELLRTGNDIADLSGTEMERAIIETATNSIISNAHALVWGGDTNETDDTINTLDGVITLMTADVNVPKFSIPSVLIAGSGIAAMEAAYDGAPIKLKQAAVTAERPGIFYVSRSIYDRYRKDLQVNGVAAGTSEGFQVVVNGITREGMRYNGFPMVPVDIVDVLAEEFPLTIPANFVLFTYQRNIAIGANAADEVAVIESFYYQKDMVQYFRNVFNIGVKYREAAMMNFGSSLFVAPSPSGSGSGSGS